MHHVICGKDAPLERWRIIAYASSRKECARFLRLHRRAIYRMRAVRIPLGCATMQILASLNRNDREQDDD